MSKNLKIIDLAQCCPEDIVGFNTLVGGSVQFVRPDWWYSDKPVILHNQAKANAGVILALGSVKELLNSITDSTGAKLIVILNNYFSSEIVEEIVEKMPVLTHA